MTRRRTGAIALTTAAAALLLLASGSTDRLELPMRDGALRLRPPAVARHTVVVAIDEVSLRTAGPWPWDRPRIAALVSALQRAGCRGVVLDVLLTDPRPGDELLASATRGVPTIAVSVLDDRGSWLLPSPPLRASVTPAHGHFELDFDGILRHLSATKQNRTTSLSAIPVQASSLVTGAPVPVGRLISPAFRARARDIPQVRALDVLDGRADGNLLRGRVAFVGPTALALGDRVLTPTSERHPDPGVTVHASATESIIAREVIAEVPPLYGAAALGVFAYLLLRQRSRLRRAIVLAAELIAISAAAAVLLNNGHYLPFATLSAVLLSVVLATEGAALFNMLRRSHAIAGRLESELGISAPEGDVAPRLESIASRLDERRERDAEARRRLAHELRTPLASMRGLTQLLNRFELSASERDRVAHLLESEAGKLETMVEVLLDLERLGGRSFEATASTFDLNDLASRRVQFLQAGTGRTLKLHPSGPVPVRGDASLMERVVDNLVTNALRYTSGAVTVRVSPQSSDAVLDVEDEGPGIPPAERSRIFERFFRGSTAAGSQGLGLGLSLVAEIVSWHRGQVQILESSGQGTIFRITMPLHDFDQSGTRRRSGLARLARKPVSEVR